MLDYALNTPTPTATNTHTPTNTFTPTSTATNTPTPTFTPTTIVGPLVVNSINDVDDTACNITHCSLREAINAANAAGGAQAIEFETGLTGTILLQSVLPTISDDVQILGPRPTIITVSGDSDNDTTPDVKAFNISSGTIYLSGLSIAYSTGD